TEAESLGSASIRGSVFRVGEYPGYQSEPDGVVHGELWRLSDPRLLLAALDDYEGAGYTRKEVAVVTPQSENTVTAWVYVYTGPVQMEQRILSGDFLAP